MSYGPGRWRLGLVLVVLVLLHFGLRPLLGEGRAAPDFLLLALLVYAIGARPGNAAIAGFFVGLLADSLSSGVGLLADSPSPGVFGAGIFAHTVIGYMAAWGKAVFFAENLWVNAAMFFAGVWLRNGLFWLVARQAQGTEALWALGYWSPLLALTTSITGVVVLLAFRNWMHVRIGE